MSAALQILNAGTAALVATHGDSLTLRPIGTAVTGYAQDLLSDPQGEGKLPPQFHFDKDNISHAVHIQRSQLAAVTLSEVVSIEQAGTTKKYRVKHVVDDPNKSEVAFYCTMS